MAIGLGSNIGDRLEFLKIAAEKLSSLLSDIQISSIYETPALLPENAPKEWDINFYNCVATGFCKLEPEALLENLKAIEANLGRQNRGHWSPREVDLDIICWGNLTLSTNKLTIPHPQMHERLFVLAPLAELLPDWEHPHLNENFANCRHYYERLAASSGETVSKTELQIIL